MIYLLGICLIPILVGFVFVDLFFDNPKMTLNQLVMKFSLGTGLGLGIYSCLTFLSLSFFDQSKLPLIIIDFLGLTFVVVYLLIQRAKYTLVIEHKARANKFIKYIFVLAVFFALTLFILESSSNPNGNWDGMFIWNMHTNFLYRLGENWREFFQSGQSWIHLDYPLLLPMINLRGVILNQCENAFVSVFTSFMFMIATVGLLITSLSELKNKTSALLAGIFLIASPFFILESSGQTADVPFSFFILATFVSFFLAEKNNQPKLFALAGLSAGLSVWCKNEGALFIGAILFAIWISKICLKQVKRLPRQLAYFIAGLLPVLILVLSFKLQFAPPNELFLGQTTAIIFSKLISHERWLIVGKYFLNMFFAISVTAVAMFIPFVLGAITGVNVDKKYSSWVLMTWLTIFFVFIGYFIIYLFTPRELLWHLQTSLNRLFLQYWATFIFICFTTFSFGYCE